MVYVFKKTMEVVQIAEDMPLMKSLANIREKNIGLKENVGTILKEPTTALNTPGLFTNTDSRKI